MWWDWGLTGWGWVAMGFMILFMVAFWGGIIFLIVWGIKKLTERTGTTTGRGEWQNPLDIAKERYAKGEITKEQYEQLKRDIS